MDKHYQFPEWFEKNNDNFINSKLWRDLVQQHNTDCFDPYFLPSDFLRFGRLVKGYINHTDIFLYLVEIPEGCQTYHSSRSLVVNNSGFPIQHYDVSFSSKENKKRDSIETTNKGLCWGNVDSWTSCITNTYFSSTPQKEYLHKDSGFLGSQIRYSFGFDDLSPSSGNTLISDNYNDRSAYHANDTSNGVIAYRTKKKTYLIAIPDKFFMNRCNITRHNINTLIPPDDQITMDHRLKSTIGLSLKSNIQTAISLWKNMNEETALKWFQVKIGKIFDSLSNYQNLINFDCLGDIKFIYQAFLFRKNTFGENYNLNDFLKEILYSEYGSIDGYVNYELFTIGGNISIIPGIRMSMYETDRPFHTYIKKLCSSLDIYVEGESIKLDGIAGGYLYNPRFDPKPAVMNGNFFPSNEEGLFHSEMVLFYAPDTLEISTKNINGVYYGINSLGLFSELRKYKTLNILEKCQPGVCKGWKNFHQGHLYEHSVWTALNAINIAHSPELNIHDNDILFIAAGALHDIGKGGSCGYVTYDWKDYNPHALPIKYSCNIVQSSNEDIGFQYYDVPIHPEKGFSILYGLTKFHVFNFKKDMVQNLFKVDISHNLVSKDWEKYGIDNGLTEDDMKYIRISTGAHWYLGPIIGSLINGEDSIDNLVDKYLNKIELFYNSEYLRYDPEKFKNAVLLTMIISYADILGALYDKNIPEREYVFNLYNEDPNYKISLTLIDNLSNKFSVDPRPLLNYNLGGNYSKENIKNFLIFNINDQDIQNLIRDHTSTKDIHNIELDLSKIKLEDFPPPKLYAMNIQKSFFIFRNKCLYRIDNRIYKPHPNNSFLTLDNLLNSFDTYKIFKAYGGTKYVPKVLAFDLDGTLLYVTGHINEKTRNPDNGIFFNGKYEYVADIKKIIDLCNFLRKNYDVKITVATRHYIQKRLAEEMNDRESPIYKENFDLVVSQFTGNLDILRKFCNGNPACINMLEPCDNSPNCERGKYGFRHIEGNKFYNSGSYDPSKPEYLGSEKDSVKIPHMREIKDSYKVGFEDIMLFDDSERYIVRPGQTLGGNVFTVGVRDEDGLTFDLFCKSIAIYVFEKLSLS
jgi:hypothetical protein